MDKGPHERLYLALFLLRRAVKGAGCDPFEEFLELVHVEEIRGDLAPLLGHNHDYWVVAQTDHNY